MPHFNREFHSQPRPKRSNELYLTIEALGIRTFLFASLALLVGVAAIEASVEVGLQHWLRVSIFTSNNDYFDNAMTLFASFFNISPGPASITPLGQHVFLINTVIGYFGLAICAAFFVSKATNADSDTIVLSDHAYYLLDSSTFGIMAVNTTRSTLTNLRVLSVFRIGRRHANTFEVALPYLSNSALYLMLSECEMDRARANEYDPVHDGLKVSVEAELNGLHFSISRKYLARQIIIMPNSNFMDVPIFEEPNLSNRWFWHIFHHPMPEAPTLDEKLAALRK